jgi:hypothetical protein
VHRRGPPLGGTRGGDGIVNTVATIGKVGWCHGIVGDGHGSEADWARACDAL